MMCAVRSPRRTPVFNVWSNAAKYGGVVSAALLLSLHTFAGLNKEAKQKPIVPLLRQEAQSGVWRLERDPLEAERKLLGVRTIRGRRIHTWEVRFTSHTGPEGAPVRIFGYYACPEPKKEEEKSRRPAVLLVHGGGGYATLDRVLEGAGRGFAALAIDLPGKGTNREAHSRSTGPDFTVANIYDVAPTPRKSYLYHAVRAEMRAITFLAAQPEVDAKRIGLVGASWGGATGLIATSLDPRIRCFVNVFGAGYVREGSTWRNYFAKMPAGAFDTWEAHYDASRFAPDIRVPVLGIAATNDGCYWLPQFLKTMQAVGTGQAQASKDPSRVQLICLPNRDHKIDQPAHAAMYRWLEARLMQQPAQWAARKMGTLRVAPEVRDRKDAAGMLLGREVEVALTETGKEETRPATQSMERVEIAYAAVRPGEGHTARRWEVLAAARIGGEWRVRVPAATQLTYAFATVYGRDGSMQSTPIATIARYNLPGRGRCALAVPFLTNRPARVIAYNHAQWRLANANVPGKSVLPKAR